MLKVAYHYFDNWIEPIENKTYFILMIFMLKYRQMFIGENSE